MLGKLDIFCTLPAPIHAPHRRDGSGRRDQYDLIMLRQKQVAAPKQDVSFAFVQGFTANVEAFYARLCAHSFIESDHGRFVRRSG